MITKLNVYKEQLVTLEEDKDFLKQELEASVNSLPDNYITAKRKLREEYNQLITQKSTLIADLKDKIGKIEIEMVDTGIDVGPLLYIADAFDTDIDTAVKWIMFILILVFDPLAVIMVIGFNIALLNEKRKDENDDSDTKLGMYSTQPPTPQVYTALDDEEEEEEETTIKGIGEVGDEEVTTTPSNPLEAWQKETEETIEKTGMSMGNNPSLDNNNQESEYPKGRK